MNNNPYRPSAAAESAAATPAAVVPAPKSIGLGRLLYVISLLLYPLIWGLDAGGRSTVSANGAALVAGAVASTNRLTLSQVLLGLFVIVAAFAIAFVVPVWLLRAIRRGHSWARIVLAVSTVVAWGLFVSRVIAEFDSEPLIGSLAVADWVLQTIAVAMFFAPSVNRWFRDAVES